MRNRGDSGKGGLGKARGLAIPTQRINASPQRRHVLPTSMLDAICLGQASYSKNVDGLNSLIAYTPHWPFVAVDRQKLGSIPRRCIVQLPSNVMRTLMPQSESTMMILFAQKDPAAKWRWSWRMYSGVHLFSAGRPTKCSHVACEAQLSELEGFSEGKIIGKIGEISIGTAGDQSFAPKSSSMKHRGPVQRRRKPTSHFAGFQATAPSGS